MRAKGTFDGLIIICLQRNDTMTTARTENTKQRILVTILLACIAIVSYYFILNRIHNRILLETSKREMKETAQYLETACQDVRESFEYARKADEEIFYQNLSLMSFLSSEDPQFEISDRYLKDIGSFTALGEVMIADTKGQVLASSGGEHEELPGEIRDLVREASETGSPVILRQKRDISQEMMPEEETKETEGTEKSQDPAQFTQIWMVSMFDKEHAFVLADIDWMLSFGVQKQDEWKLLLENRMIGQEGFVFAWSDETNQILYYPGFDAENLTTDALGLDQNLIRDDAYGWQNLDGRRVYLYTIHDEEEGVWIACADPLKSLDSTRKFTVTVFCIVFGLLTADLAYYIILLLRQKKVRVFHDFTGAERKNDKKGKKHKLLILTGLLSMLLFLFQFYLQTLYLMSGWAGFASRQTAWISQKMEAQEALAKTVTECYEEGKKDQLRTLASFLAARPEQCTAAVLDSLSFLIGASRIQILDERGKAEISSSSMSYSGALKQEEEAEEALSPSEAVAAQDNGKSLLAWMSEGRKVMLPLETDGQSDSGSLYVLYYSQHVEDFLQSLTQDRTLHEFQPGNGGIVFTVDKESRIFTYYPDKELQGRDALQYGLTKNQIRDNYSDYITVNGTSYYTVTDELGTDLVFCSITRSRLLAQRTQLCLLATAAAVALFFLTGLALYTGNGQVEMVRPDEERHAVLEDHDSPENKALRVLGYYLVAAAGIIAVYSFFRANSGTGGVIGYVLDGKWERGFNVFALFSSAIIMSEGGIILFLFSRTVQAVGSILPIREGTILKMLGSLVTYVAIGFLIYQCMLCFGLNPTALMASAGIVSVVLGIGANSLVGDILAGIFLLMEGNVQVGDVVQIGDFRGYVIEMGIRMTKLFDMDMDDVKIIPNNEVRNVVHMTMHVSIVYSDFQIRYEEKLENVEKILCEELKNVKDKSPLILEGPVYIGVRALDANGVVLRTKTKCHEPCRRKVEREVNHIVYSIFQKNQISVPYPQITLHEGDDSTVER